MLKIKPHSTETLLILEISGKLSKDDFKKIAIIGDDQLQRGLSKFADMISTGEIKFFATENKTAALAWAKA